MTQAIPLENNHAHDPEVAQAEDLVAQHARKGEEKREFLRVGAAFLAGVPVVGPAALVARGGVDVALAVKFYARKDRDEAGQRLAQGMNEIGMGLLYQGMPSPQCAALSVNMMYESFSPRDASTAKQIVASEDDKTVQHAERIKALKLNGKACLKAVPIVGGVANLIEGGKNLYDSWKAFHEGNSKVGLLRFKQASGRLTSSAVNFWLSSTGSPVLIGCQGAFAIGSEHASQSLEEQIIKLQGEQKKPDYKPPTQEEQAADKKEVTRLLLAGMPVVGGMIGIARGARDVSKAVQAYAHHDSKLGTLHLKSAIQRVALGTLNLQYTLPLNTGSASLMGLNAVAGEGAGRFYDQQIEVYAKQKQNASTPSATKSESAGGVFPPPVPQTGASNISTKKTQRGLS